MTRGASETLEFNHTTTQRAQGKKILPDLIQDANSRFPLEVRRRLRQGWPRSLASLGDLDTLRHARLGLICSIRCPGSIIIKTFDVIRELRDLGVAVIGGFHSPMEKECLDLLLRGTQPIVICPARSIESMRIPGELRKSVEEKRVLIISPFPKKARRVTKKNATIRNRFVAGLANKVFVPHAAPGGKTEALCREIVSWQKPLITFDDPSNKNLIEMGAVSIGPDDVEQLMPDKGKWNTALHECCV